MKIAMVGQKGIPCTTGGVERHVENLSVLLKREGHDILVYARFHYTPRNLKNYKGVKIVFKPSFYSKNFDAITHTFFSVLDAIFKQKVDVIHFHGIGPALLAWLPRILSSRIKVVGTFHSPDWEHQKWSWFARTMLKLGAFCICKFPHETIVVSKELQKYCLEKYNQETHYISYGINFDNCRQVSADLLKQFALESNKYFLMVSRLVRHKGIHLLVNAFKKAKLQGWKLAIVGSPAFTDDYGEYLQKLKQGRDDIVLTGNQFGDNLVALYTYAYLYVHPSSSEGLCNSILEAMSYKKPPLVADIPQNREAIEYNSEDNAKGFIFKDKDIDALIKKLRELVKKQELVKEKGKLAFEHIYLNYNIEEVVRKVEQVYQKTVLIKDQVKDSRFVYPI